MEVKISAYNKIEGAALFNKNQNGIKKFIPLDVRQSIKKSSLILRAPKEYLLRKKTLNEALRYSPVSQIIPKSGIASLVGEDLPYHSVLVDHWSGWANNQIEEKERSTTKYSRHLASAVELLSHQETLKFALSHELLSIVGKYLGTAPSFANAGLWWGKSGERYAGSPAFHLDSLDTSCIRIYVYLSHVGDGNGPLCVVPRQFSLKFIRKTGYLGNGIADTDVYKVVDRRKLGVLTGEKGSVFAADTTKCLHYGSRCTEGDRIALIFTYASYHNFDNNSDVLKCIPPLDNPTKLQEMAYTHYSFP